MGKRMWMENEEGEEDGGAEVYNRVNLGRDLGESGPWATLRYPGPLAQEKMRKKGRWWQYGKLTAVVGLISTIQPHVCSQVQSQETFPSAHAHEPVCVVRGSLPAWAAVDARALSGWSWRGLRGSGFVMPK